MQLSDSSHAVDAITYAAITKPMFETESLFVSDKRQTILRLSFSR
jgi:hypothetical protein